MMTRRSFGCLLTGLALVASSVGRAGAATDAEKCEAAKLKIAGKYAFCRLKAEAKGVQRATAPDYGKCDQKYGPKWTQAESRAGLGVCPSEGDEAALQSLITQQCDDVATALAGGALPDCAVDLATCTDDLATCSGDYAACGGSLATCDADLTTCDGDLTQSQTDLSACGGDLATCGGELTQAQSDLGTCNGDLTTCGTDLTQAQGDLATCNGDLATCGTDLTACSSNLATCNGDLSQSQGDLAVCSADLGTCGDDLVSCATDLAAVGTGTAAPAEVVSGRTFSSGAGIGATGTMTDNGTVNITPGVAAQAIAAGYHDGGGSVAGDSDLLASNIKDGVEIFGVTGTLQSPLLSTGQTTSYGAGSDGALQLGAGRSFLDNGDGTVTDQTTGLMWEKKSDDGGIHDKDNTYTWGLAASPFSMSGTMVSVFLATLNGGGGFATYTDWRIPNINELHTLLNYQNVNPSVDAAFNTACAPACTVTTCSCTQVNLHWSSSTQQNGPAGAWLLSFFDGDVTAISKSNARWVRAVRGP